MAKSLIDNQSYRFFYDGDKTICKFRFDIDFDSIPGICAFSSEMWSDFIKRITSIAEIKIVECYDYAQCATIELVTKTVVHESGDDEYDKRRGEHIVLTKAQRNAFRVARRIIRDAMDIVESRILSRMRVKYECDDLNARRAQAHLDELINA